MLSVWLVNPICLVGDSNSGWIVDMNINIVTFVRQTFSCQNNAMYMSTNNLVTNKCNLWRQRRSNLVLKVFLDGTSEYQSLDVTSLPPNFH